jgi:nucleotidyltransferase substrate binding protein (TIGR01987 family)
MSNERFAERKAELRKALKRLQEAVAEPESALVRDAVIQRFEFTFELVWKSLKLYLERQGLDCGGPRSTLKKAFTEGLIGSADEADVWFRLLEDRNLTAHAYDEAVAARIYGHIVKDYTGILAEMVKKIQTLAWD